MASLRDIRKRIKSVKSTRQITKAMKMVAAAKLRKAQEAVVATRPYSLTLRKLIATLAKGASEGDAPLHPLLESRPVKKAELVVLTSDRGLAGGFNANVTRRALKFLREESSALESVSVTTVGRKGGDFLKARGQALRKDFPGLLAKVNYASASEVSTELTARFLSGEVDAVYVVSTYFKSAINQEVHLRRLLPLDPTLTAEETAGAAAGDSPDYAFEPDAKTVLAGLLPKAVSMFIYRSLLESSASEHGARMTAMENATKNAGEMLSSLTLYYNRTRQSVITKELVEIVSGAESLKG
jgi:F-type H+-transporting ATPase subunit gamma